MANLRDGHFDRVEGDMMQLVVDDQTARSLQQWARVRAVTTDQLAEEAIRAYVRAETQRALQREIDAFVEMHAWLLANYPGEYAAISDGQLVDHDADQVDLFLRMEERFPDTPVLIRQIGDEPEVIIHVHSPRLEHG